MFDRKRLVGTIVFLAALVLSTAGLASATQGTVNFNNGFGTITYDITTVSGACGTNGTGSYTEYEYSNLTYVDPNGKSWSLGGGGAYYTATLSEQEGCPPSGAEPSSIVFGSQSDGWQVTWYPGYDGGTANLELYGYLTPKYQVLSLFYAPPGHSSYVQYTNVTTVGTSVSLSQALTQSYGVSVQNSSLGGSTTSGNDYSQTEDSNASVDVSVTTSFSYEIKGPQPDTSQTDAQMDALGLDHGYDELFLWLDPSLNVEVTPGAGITWEGFGVNPVRTQDDIETVALEPRQIESTNFPTDLKTQGNAFYDPKLYDTLQRSWDTTLSSPALNSSDYSNILSQDPFAHDLHATSTCVNLTHYSPLSSPEPEFDYDNNQSAEAYTFTYNAADSEAAGESTTNSINFGWTNTYSALENLFKQSLTNTTALKLENKYSVTYTQKVGQSVTASITGPVSGSGYTGADLFMPFVDNLYGTIMFYPDVNADDTYCTTN